MNILILSWRGIGHPNAGGAEKVTFEHARAWAKAGHKVFLFTAGYLGGKESTRVNGVRIIRRGDQYLTVRLQAFWWYLFGQHPEIDLVVDEFHGIPFFTPLFVRKKKLAFIHEVARDVWWLNPLAKPLNSMVAIAGSFFEPWIFRIFYRGVPFMTVSPSTKADLVKWGIKEDIISVIYNGVNIIKLNPRPRREKRSTAIYLGALSKDKGIEDAVEVFARIYKKEPTWQFWVVGKADEKYGQWLKINAQKSGLENNLKYWGYVNEKKKFELLARAHVLVNPSIREGWGLVNIEAAAMGTPVVAYNVAGCRDSVKNEETGILVEKKNVSAMVNAILKLSKDKVFYKNLQKKALLWCKKNTWEKAREESLRLLEEIAGE